MLVVHPQKGEAIPQVTENHVADYNSSHSRLQIPHHVIIIILLWREPQGVRQTGSLAYNCTYTLEFQLGSSYQTVEGNRVMM